MALREQTDPPIEILLVEDNPGDVDLIIEGLREAAIPNHLNVVSDGVEALSFLRRQNAYSGANRPGLILLDLNLPRKDGREVLAEIKSDPDLKHIPVIILTSSDSEKDVEQSYRIHANCYVKKPTDLQGFLDVVQSIEKFWLVIARLPT